LQHFEELPKRSVHQLPGQLSVFHHPGYIQIFHKQGGHRLVIAGEPTCYLLDIIDPLVSNLLM
jgi:hypothetical protein